MEKAAVRHHVRRIQFADSDGVRKQRCRRGIQSSLLSGVTNHRGKLRGGARRRELFLRLNTHQAQYAVSRRVENRNHRFEHNGEQGIKGDDPSRSLKGVRKSEILWNKLSKNHGENIDQNRRNSDSNGRRNRRR